MLANEPITLSSNSYEKVKTFKYLGSLLRNKNSIHEDIKYRLKAGNACYLLFSTNTFVLSTSLFENLKIKIYKTIIFPVMLYGCKTCSLTLRELQGKGI